MKNYKFHQPIDFDGKKPLKLTKNMLKAIGIVIIFYIIISYLIFSLF